MDFLRFYISELTPSLVVDIGIIITAATIVLTIITFMVLIIKKVKLEKQLEIEYGSRRK